MPSYLFRGLGDHEPGHRGRSSSDNSGDGPSSRSNGINHSGNSYGNGYGNGGRSSSSNIVGTPNHGGGADTNRLLLPPPPAKRKGHQVRVQGRLAPVQSVSAINVRRSPTPIARTPRASPTTGTTDTPAIPTGKAARGGWSSHDPGVGSVFGGGVGIKGHGNKRHNQKKPLPLAQGEWRPSVPGNGNGGRRRNSMGDSSIRGSQYQYPHQQQQQHQPQHLHGGRRRSGSYDHNSHGFDSIDYGYDYDFDDDSSRAARESADADETDDDDDDEAGMDMRETALRDRQRRGYGIGGAGNIRRPTEVIHFTPSPTPLSPSSKWLSSFATGGGERTERRNQRWQWMNNLLGRGPRKDKQRQESGNAVVVDTVVEHRPGVEQQE